MLPINMLRRDEIIIKLKALISGPKMELNVKLMKFHPQAGWKFIFWILSNWEFYQNIASFFVYNCKIYYFHVYTILFILCKYG